MHVAAWLADIGYVVKASEGLFKLDYTRCRQFLRNTLGETQAFLFNGYDPIFGIPNGLQMFYDSMRRAGMEVRLHQMDSGAAGANRQRRVDVDLAAHLIWQASLSPVATLILTTGDQDFVPAVQMVKEHLGKRVILFTYGQSVHHELIDAADEWWRFEEHADRVKRP